MGRFEDAAREGKLALLRDPLFLIIHTVQGWIQYYARDYPSSIALMDQAPALDANHVPARIFKSLAQMGQESLADAITEINRTIEVSDSTGLALTSLAYAYAQSSDIEEARQTAEIAGNRGSAGLCASV